MLAIVMLTPDHSTGEQRYVDIGSSERDRVLIVVYTERGASIRIISCRKATPQWSGPELMKKATGKAGRAKNSRMRAEYDSLTGRARQTL